MPLNIKPIGGSDRARKLPGSKKCASVKATINSGFNAIKQSHKENERQQNTRFHRGEHFRRVTVKQLAQLFEASEVEVLILDLRDEEEYQKCRLAAAWSYPLRLLSRAFNPFTPEILAFRNQEPSRIILLYDHGDDLAASAANLMFEKGIDNVFVLNGGLQMVHKHRPDLLEGDLAVLLPAVPLQASIQAGRMSKERMIQSRCRTAGSQEPLPLWK